MMIAAGLNPDADPSLGADVDPSPVAGDGAERSLIQYMEAPSEAHHEFVNEMLRLKYIS